MLQPSNQNVGLQISDGCDQKPNKNFGHINDRTLNVSLHERLVGQMVHLRTFPKCLRLNTEFHQEKTFKE